MTSPDAHGCDPDAHGGDDLVQVGVTGFGLARPSRVPKTRYTSADFMARELERMWPRVWQVACSVDHVASAGDWFEHRAGTTSVLVVRGDDGTLRAFQNVCRHRGNLLCEGAGEGLTQLQCPFHHWTWDLGGRLREVPSRKTFGTLRNDDFPLVPVHVDTWGPLVFVNLDPRETVEPLTEYLEGVPADTSWARLDEFRCQVTARIPVPCNWKIVAEGFSESYHIQGLHPELLASVDDVNGPQRIFGKHGVLYQDYGVPSPRLGADVSDASVWESFVRTQGDRVGIDRDQADAPAPPVADGATMRDAIASRIREYQSTFGIDLAAYDTEQLLRLSQYNLFPNSSVLVWGDELNVLVALPGRTPDSAELLVFVLHRVPSPEKPRRRPRDHVFPPDGDIGPVFNQDVSVLKTAQRGLEQPGLTHITLSSEECRVVNLHRTLERYLDITPTELTPLPS
jgi:phenylpropionate dioxygenase-like ring-hydroxylating dioxygenase large terminal subunit